MVWQVACPQTLEGQVHCPSAAPVQLPAHAALDPAQPEWPACGAPTTGVQMPVPMSQASQGPLHALSQQWPSAEQKVPEAQSVVTLQVCPCLLLHVPEASQVPEQ